MPDRTSTSRRNFALRLAVSIILVLAGGLIVALTKDVNTIPLFVAQQFGISLMVAGAVSIVLEVFLERWKPEADILPPYLGSRGIQILTNIRQGDPRYHQWVLVTTAQDLFFAGRSVLHRIRFDFEDRKIPGVDEILMRKLKEGSRIRILFCHPLWELIDDLAKAENQPPEKIRNDLRISLEIVYRLWQRLNESRDSFPGEIEIKLYRELVQYAYHRTQAIGSDDVTMYIGMYFSRKIGSRSPLFEVYDRSIQREFEEHFDNVFSTAESLLFYPRTGVGKCFDSQTYHNAISVLQKPASDQE